MIKQDRSQLEGGIVVSQMQDLKLKFTNTIQILKATMLQVKFVTIMLRLYNENKLLIIKFYFFIFTKKNNYFTKKNNYFYNYF